MARPVVDFIRNIPYVGPRLRRLKHEFVVKRTRFLHLASVFKPPLYFAFRRKAGLEIGGPSALFERDGLFPVYRLLRSLDGVNFSEETLWEGRLRDTESYLPKLEIPGRQYIAEATDLAVIPDSSYDIVLSAHCLEHSANPIKAMMEWTRVLKPGGYLLVIVPDRHLTFDHRRPVTTFEHLLSDYENDVGEDDLTHLDEILRLHDFSRDELAGGEAAFRERSLKNHENRGLHQHVFDRELVVTLFEHLGHTVSRLDTYQDYHILCLGRKPSQKRTRRHCGQPADTSKE